MNHQQLTHHIRCLKSEVVPSRFDGNDWGKRLLGYGLVFGLYVAFTPFCLFAAWFMNTEWTEIFLETRELLRLTLNDAYIYIYNIRTYIYITVSVTISKHIHEATWSVAGFRDFLISLPYMMECWNTSLVRFQHEKRLPGPRLSSCESHGFFFTKRCWRWMQDMLETGMPPSCKKRYFEPNVIAQLI